MNPDAACYHSLPFHIWLHKKIRPVDCRRTQSRPLYDARKVDAEKLSECSLIIFGGSLHAVGINGLNLLKDNLPKLADKKIIVFAVGASPPKEGILDEIGKNNFSHEQQRHLKLFYLRGGFNYGKLDFRNKVLMALLRVKLAFKRNKMPDERGMLAAYAKPMDFTKAENIGEIVAYARSLISD